jgi:hypothetical protein
MRALLSPSVLVWVIWQVRTMGVTSRASREQRAWFLPEDAFWTTTHVLEPVVVVSVPPGPQSDRFLPCLPDVTWTTFVFFVQFHLWPGHLGPA